MYAILVISNVMFRALQKEEEIAKKVLPSLSKVETILNKYQEAIINASEDEYIDLDRIDVIYDYPNGYKFRKNCTF